MEGATRRTYVVFDRSTGAVLGISTHFDAGTGDYREQSLDQVVHQFGGLLGGRTAKEVDVLDVDLPAEAFQQGYHVDVHRRQLVPKHQIRLEAARVGLEGDGNDSTEIVITVVDGSGKVVKGFEGEIRVSTSRGRLSHKGGRVKARGGTCRVTLTSAPETVEHVVVSARDPAGRCDPGAVTIEFL